MADYFEIGKLVAHHGLKGELLLKHSLGKKSALTGLKAIFIEDPKGVFIPWFLELAKVKSEDETYLKLEGVNNREEAQKLTRKKVWLPGPDYKKFASKNTPSGLLGYSIIDNGENLGEILEVIEQPHQLLCRLELKGREVLIPLHEESLERVDHRKKEVRVILPPGLIDIYIT